jgi:hypothetical protein
MESMIEMLRSEERSKAFTAPNSCPVYDDGVMGRDGVVGDWHLSRTDADCWVVPSPSKDIVLVTTFLRKK